MAFDPWTPRGLSATVAWSPPTATHLVLALRAVADTGSLRVILAGSGDARAHKEDVTSAIVGL